MDLHIPTLFAAILVGFLMLTLELGLAQGGLRARPELRRWTWGSWACLLGFLALLARLVVPVPVSVVVGNGLLFLGIGLYHQAICQLLRDGQAPTWPLKVQPVLWLLLVAMAWSPLAQRTAVISWIYAGLMAPSAWVLLRSDRQAARSLRTLAVPVVASVLSMLVRGGHALVAPELYANLLQPGLSQGLTFLLAFMALLGVGFGFVLAVFERVAHQMEEMASHDGLTGCLNRRTTDALLEHALARARREGTPLAFVLLDLDHFKHINDQHGHRAGDEALRQFAQAARQRLRNADVMGRTGGEEFGLVLPGTDAPGARRLVEDVRLATENLALVDAEGRTVRVTVSAGVAVAASDDEVSADRLYGRADQALYEAKRLGRNRVELFADPDQRQASLLAAD